MGACCAAMSLASCATSCATCLTSQCCGRSGDDGEEGSEGGISNFIRVKYAMILVLGFSLCLWIKDGFTFATTGRFGFLATGCNHSSFAELCNGHTYVYRICFVLAVFYIIHLLISLPWPCTSGEMDRGLYKLHANYFLPKCLVLLFLFFLTTRMPNGFFSGFAEVCFFGAGVFIVMQILILLDFAYEWNDNWIAAGDEDEDSRKPHMLVAVTLFFYIAGFTLIGLMYHWFAGDGCTRNQVFITTTAVMGVLYTLSAFAIPRASIMPASVVFIYTSYLCYSALRSGNADSPTCNKLWEDDDGSGWSLNLVLGCLFAIVSLVYSCISASSSRGAFQLVVQDEEGGKVSEGSDVSYWGFHLILTLGTFYMAMLLTSWSVDGVGRDGSLKLDSSIKSMWVKIVSQWVTIGLYVWSQMAPLVLTDRDFD